MSNQLLKDRAALRMFFTDTLYVPAGQPATGSEQVPVDSEQTAVSSEQEELAVAAAVAQEEQLPVGSERLAEVPVPVPGATQRIDFKFIGKNNRGILLLVNDPANAVSNEAGTVLLRNIVKHLQFDKDDFALLNYAQYPGTSFKTLQEFFKCSTLLAFGVAAADLGFENVPGASHLAGETRIVFGAPLHEMADSQDAKKQFWGVLKTIDKW